MAVIRVLVVEDEAIVAKDIQNRLIKMGYEVPAVAHTGRDAVALADALLPDLILMDIRLRGSMDGIMAAECIREVREVPVIFLTAYSDENTVQRAKATSPMAYLIKPFEDRDLHISIEMALYRHYTSRMLAASEKKYRGIFEGANDLIVNLDATGVVIDMNRKIEDVCGYHREELLGKSIKEIDFFPDEAKPDIVGIFEAALLGRAKTPVLVEMIHRDGHSVFVEGNYSLVEGENGEPALLVVLRDVTQRIALEQQLQERNELLDSQNEELRASEDELKRIIEELAEARAYSESLIRSLNDGFVVLDFDETVLDANDALFQITGLNREEVIGHSLVVEKYLPQDEWEAGRQRVKSFKSGIEIPDIEVLYRRPDGTEIILSVNHNIVRDASGNPLRLLMVLKDITERKRAEEAIKSSEERFREMAELMPMCVSEVDLKGKVTFANKYAFDLFDYTREEFTQKINLLDTVLPEDRSRAMANINRVFQGERFHGNEYAALKKDGTPFPIMVYSNPIEKDGRIIGLRVVTVDLTDRKRAEEQAARANALEEINRLKTILLATVSHELRTPLTSIKGLASTLIQPDVIWDGQTQKEFLYEIDKAADRLTHIVGDLIDMSQLEAGMMKLEKSPTTITILLEQLAHQLEGVTSEHEFVMDIAPDMPIIYCDEIRIGQVVTNLVSNAAGYSEPGTRILLEARCHRGTVEVSVTDEGIGIPEDKIDSIFDRFHRLETGAVLRRGGTGLGLSICKGIIRNHGGKIQVESVPGRGSRFSILLPIPEGDEIFCGDEEGCSHIGDGCPMGQTKFVGF